MERLIRELEDKAEGIVRGSKKLKLRKLITRSMYYFVVQVARKVKYLEAIIGETFKEEKGDFFIFTFLMPKSELPVYEQDFQPVIKPKRKKENYFNLEKKSNLILDHVPITGMNSNELEGRRFNGLYTFEEKKYKFEIELQKNHEYMKKVSELYNVFRKNKKNWRGFPSYYFENIYDMKVVRVEQGDEVENAGFIFYEKYSIDFEEIQKNVHIDCIPVWNVFSDKRNEPSRVRPVKNRYLYEYNFGKHTENNTLIKTSSEILSVFRDDAKNLMAYFDKETIWTVETLYLKQNIDEKKYIQEKSQVLSTKILYFGENQKRNFNDMRLVEKFELKKYLNRFNSLKELSLEEMNFVEAFDSNSLEAKVDYIENEFDLMKSRKKMELSFSCKNINHANELIHFAVDVVSVFFPEYMVRGRLLHNM